jgi:uncharacterized protein (TIGR02147 family)
MINLCKKPDIFKYFDFRLYLSDLLTFFRQRDPGFTFQKLVDQYNLNSRSHYIDIINGRKLTRKFLPTYFQICELNDKEADYFKALVHYNQSKPSDDKRQHFQAIYTMASDLEIVKLESEVYDYFEHWYIPAMLSLVDINKSERDHRVLAKKLNPPITAIQARQAIDKLVNLNMISWNESRQEWLLHNKFFQCSSDAHATALKEYHKQMQKLGMSAYENDFNGQTFSTQTLSISNHLRNRIDEMILNTRKMILEEVKNDTTPEVVLQINFQTFYLSQAVFCQSKEENDGKA